MKKINETEKKITGIEVKSHVANPEGKKTKKQTTGLKDPRLVFTTNGEDRTEQIHQKDYKTKMEYEQKIAELEKQLDDKSVTHVWIDKNELGNLKCENGLLKHEIKTLETLKNTITELQKEIRQKDIRIGELRNNICQTKYMYNQQNKTLNFIINHVSYLDKLTGTPDAIESEFRESAGYGCICEDQKESKK